MQKKNLEQKINYLILLIYYGSILTLSFLILKYLLPLIFPFVLGFFITFILHPISQYISQKLKIKNKISRLIIILLVFLLIIFLIWIISVKIISALKSFANSSQEIYEIYIIPIQNFFKNNTTSFLKTFFPTLENQTNEILETVTSSLYSFMTSNSNYILKIIAKFGTRIPEFLIDLTFCVICALYFSYDYEKITKYISNLFPEKVQNFLLKTKGFTIRTIIKYIKSYLILMFICFILLSIGFFIIQIKNPIGTAAIISAFDTIPFIGSGIIIIPWALSLFISENFNLAISLLVTFFIINLLRSFIEPKILGAGLGLHPLATLFCVYIGGKILGFLGIIIFPIVTQIAFSLYKYKDNQHDDEIKNS